jgi:hypothetical protein
VKASFCFPAGRPRLSVAGRGLPGGNSLSFASPKESKQRKGDPGSCVPFASLRGNLRCSVQPGSKTTRFAQTSFCPDPSGPPLLGAYTRGGDRNTQQPKIETRIQKTTRTRHGVSLLVLVPAPDCPVLAGPRSAETSGSGLALSERSEFSQTPLGSSTAGCPERSAGTQTAGRLFFGDFLLAKQKKVTCCRAIPGQQASAEKPTTRTRTGIEGGLGTGGGGTLA